MNIIDKKPRTVLREGRSKGIGHAFCKRTGDSFETVQPISPCKDYLNDVLYSEWTGKPYDVCGLFTKKEGLFDSEKFGYLLTKVCKQGSIKEFEYPMWKEEVEILEKNHKVIEAMVRLIETDLKIKDKTSVEQAESNLYLVSVPVWWCRFTYLISLYALIFRNGASWPGNMPPIDFLSKVGGEDGYTMQTALDRLKRLIAGDVPVQDYANLHYPHSTGILGFAWPTK